MKKKKLIPTSPQQIVIQDVEVPWIMLQPPRYVSLSSTAFTVACGMPDYIIFSTPPNTFSLHLLAEVAVSAKRRRLIIS
uniref:Uncharacterized protein n=1 Tax=Oryza brachyantha TaxID=4533 RepID=J3ML81_ORYBR